MIRIFIALAPLLFLLQSRSFPQDTAVSRDSLLLFLPFRNASGFGGKWNLSRDIPRYLSSYCRERFRVGTVSPLAVADVAASLNIEDEAGDDPRTLEQYALRFNVQYIVSGQIIEFSVTRFIVSEQRLAGYEAFSAEVTVHFSIIDAARFGIRDVSPVLYEGDAHGVVKDKALGITLFGKQTERTNQYFALDNLYFGGEQFNKTIIGEAMLKCADDFSSKIEKVLPMLMTRSMVLPSTVRLDSIPPDSSFSLRRRILYGEIILVDGPEAFVNLGSEDGIRIGDVLPVFSVGAELLDPKTQEVLGAGDQRVGELQVIEIRAPHLSLTTVLRVHGTLKPRYRVRAVVVR